MCVDCKWPHECRLFQIQSMSDYDVTIGMNGAGLMNGIYLPPHGTIVQLVPYEAKLNFVMYGELLAARGPYLVWHNTHEELTRAHPHDTHRGQSDTFVHTKEFIELTQKAIKMAAHNETKKHEELWYNGAKFARLKRDHIFRILWDC